jgi:hypothetical protein
MMISDNAAVVKAGLKTFGWIRGFQESAALKLENSGISGGLLGVAALGGGDGGRSCCRVKSLFGQCTGQIAEKSQYQSSSVPLTFPSADPQLRRILRVALAREPIPSNFDFGQFQVPLPGRTSRSELAARR